MGVAKTILHGHTINHTHGASTPRIFSGGCDWDNEDEVIINYSYCYTHLVLLSAPVSFVLSSFLSYWKDLKVSTVMKYIVT